MIKNCCLSVGATVSGDKIALARRVVAKLIIGGRRTEGEKTVKTHSSYILLYGTLKCA